MGRGRGRCTAGLTSSRMCTEQMKKRRWKSLRRPLTAAGLAVPRCRCSVLKSARPRCSIGNGLGVVNVGAGVVGKPAVTYTFTFNGEP